MQGRSSFPIALGGVLAALAVIIMSLGGFIPVATYVCPLLCVVILQVVMDFCGKRLAWAWYGAVCVLSILFSADKEAAATFLFLGYYPILKPTLDALKVRWLWKLLFFNGSIAIMYFLLLKIFGMPELTKEFREMGYFMIAALFILGNISFVLMDRVLSQDPLKRIFFHGK